MKNQEAKLTDQDVVTLQDLKKEKFKYKRSPFRFRKINSALLELNKIKKIAFDKIKRLLELFDWKKIKGVFFIWIVEAFIEGIVLNYITWILFGFSFNPLTIFAHGFLVKKSVEYWWRLRNNGTTSTIFDK